MTKKHLMFEIKTWPEDVPEDGQRFCFVSRRSNLSEPYIFYNDLDEANSWPSGLAPTSFDDGDTYIVLSEGEVVEVEERELRETVYGNGLLDIHKEVKTFKIIKEQEG